MAEFKYRVKNGNSIKDKPRVYFTCHPDDFDKYFERVVADIFKTQDPAVFYTEDMDAPLSEVNLSLDLGRMNLVVVPVTFKLLVEYNRAMAVDIPFALKNGIPVLPLMMEDGIVEVYSRPDRFGERQFITPDSQEKSEIAYEKKLSDFLAYALTSDELTKRVRAAFDAYVFLSYRKKDRVHANELMRLIHEDPKYRDIAIWYDEFLSPGESFRDNITKALSNSKLFALLVTPNLLETPNFVMDEEYPAARENGKPVFPVEMVETDRTELLQKYADIPMPVFASERDRFYEKLADMLYDVAISQNDTDPEHNFLIGLAYYNGIDVEVDRKRGLNIITDAAEMGSVDAMQMLVYLCMENGDDPQMLRWTNMIYEHYRTTLGENHPTTLDALNVLAVAYRPLDHKKSIELSERAYNIRVRLFGEQSEDALSALLLLAMLYLQNGNYEHAISLFERVYEIRVKTLAKEHTSTLDAMYELTAALVEVDMDRALSMAKELYSIRSSVLGDEHSDTIEAMDLLASLYLFLGNPHLSCKLYEQAYKRLCDRYGEEYPNSLRAMTNLAYSYKSIGNEAGAIQLYKKAYEINLRMYGEEHNDTFMALNELAYAYRDFGNTALGLEHLEIAYTVVNRLYREGKIGNGGEIGWLAGSYAIFEDWERAIELSKMEYKYNLDKHGEKHPYSISSLSSYASACKNAGYIGKATELETKACALCSDVYGEMHYLTLFSRKMLADYYFDMGSADKSFELLMELYPKFAVSFGEEHPETIELMRLLAGMHLGNGEKAKALELYKKEYSIYTARGVVDEPFAVSLLEMIETLDADVD